MKRISTSIRIAAPPQKVWEVLTNVTAYPEWNPFIRRLEGKLAPGTRLDVEIHPPGGSAMRFRPVVLEATMPVVLKWKGKLLIKGLFDGEHAFRLAPDAGGGTIFHHEEEFTGWLVPLLSGALVRTEQGFHAMNEALRRRCES
ncbi:MAG: SRPBCC domain-containing protein [Saprospiraceae bacterium]|nr:SRPBCC domain-containing protein [Saprospiraceae bacterium]